MLVIIIISRWFMGLHTYPVFVGLVFTVLKTFHAKAACRICLTLSTRKENKQHQIPASVQFPHTITSPCIPVDPTI